MAERTILLVDGDEDSRNVYRIMLEHAGYRVVEASGGDDALAVVGRGGIDVIVTELALPRVDGYAVMRAMEGLCSGERPYIIVVTARGLEGDRASQLSARCDAFLEKPVEPKALLSVIETELRTRGGRM